MLFTDIAAGGSRPTLEAILREHGVKLLDEISAVRRWSMACVAWPTCGLSITEAERALPGMIDQLEVELARLGLSSEAFTLRMTGCPNGCARPYNCDIGLVGKAAGQVHGVRRRAAAGRPLELHLQGHGARRRDRADAGARVDLFQADREAGETLGDFCHRKGHDDLVAWTDQFQRGRGRVVTRPLCAGRVFDSYTRGKEFPRWNRSSRGCAGCCAL